MTDPIARTRRDPSRRVAVLGLLFVAAILSCGKDVTGPLGAAGRYVRGLAFNPVYPPALDVSGGGDVVPFTKVHVVLHHSDGTIAYDDFVDFPAGSDAVTIAVTVKLLDSAPTDGESMTLNLDYVNAAGATVFSSGAVTVTAAPPTTPGGTNPPIQVPINYTGPGATAKTVTIAPRSLTVVAGAPFNFTATEADQSNQPITAPVVWSSLDPTLATVTTPGAGAGTAGTTRGTARIQAQLLTGGSDQVLVTITLPASQLIAQSGGAQTGIVGTNLANPLVVKVAAADGVGVAGTTVNFAVATGGGSVGTTSAVSDANGLAQTTFKLGTGTGVQTVTASAGSLTNSPLTFTDTARAATATKLVVTTQPVNGVAGTALTAVVVTAQDNNGNVATGFTSGVTVAFGTNTPGATLAGTTTVAPVLGVATFSGLTINKNGSAYTLVASASGVTSATTNAFDIAVGAPNKLVFTVQPTGNIANVAMTPSIVVNAQDSQGNPTPSFSSPVTLGFATNPTSATLGGTLAVTAVSGAATFSGISVSAAGIGYALSASATGLTSATSALFNVGSGGAANLVISSGSAQTAPINTALPLPVSVMVTDAGSNPVAGKTVTFAVLTGGGSVLPVSGVSNASGIVQTNWTLGSLVGVQSMSATAAGLAGSPLTITATGTAPSLFSKTWTGATSTAWATASNWSPAGVPVATDSILIPPTSNNPLITIGTTIASMTVQSGAPLTISNATLAINGRLDATGGIVGIGTGTVVLNGTVSSKTLKGTVGTNTTIFGPLSLNGVFVNTGTLVINSGGSLFLNGNAMTVNGDFATAGTGTLTMNNAADGLVINGNVSFGGGSTSGLLTNGLLSFTGNFSQSNSITSFAPSGLHSTAMVGTSSQTINISNPATSPFQALTIANNVGVVFATNVATLGNFTSAGSGTISGTVGLSVNGQFTDLSGKVQVSSLSLAGQPNPVSSGTAIINVPSVTFNNQSNLLANLAVNGSVNVNSASGNLDPNGHTLTINGTLTTVNSGSITLNNAADLMIVNGDVTMGGNSGALTNGVLQIGGNFSQITNATAFTSSSPLITRFAGTTPTISFANPTTSNLGTVQFQTSGPVNFATNAVASGNVWIRTGSTPAVTGASATVTLGAGLYDTTGGRWQVVNTVMSGSATLPKSMTTNITFGASGILVDSLKLTGNAVINASATLDLNGHYMKVTGTFGTSANGTLKMTHVNDSLVVKGNASFSGGSTAGLLTNGYFEFDGATFTQGVNTSAFAADAPHITWFWGNNAQTINFVNPGGASSHFGNLYLQDTATVLQSAVFLNGQLETGGQSSFHVSAAVDRLITSNGSNLRNIVFDNVRWKLQGTNGNGLFPSLDNVTFENISATTLPQFDYQYSVTTNLSLPGFTFLTVPTGGGVYVNVTGPDTLTFPGVSPTASGGFISTSGLGAVNGWTNSSTWTGAVSSAWATAGNWDVGVVPNASSDVIIAPATNQPATAGARSVHNLTVNSGATLNVSLGSITVGGDLVVQPSGQIALQTSTFGVVAFGNVTTDTAGTTGITICNGPSSGGLNLQAGTHNVTGKFCNLSVFGNYTATGPIRVTGSGTTGGLNIANSGGNLTLAGNHVIVDHLSTATSGTLTMNNANDSLTVANTATFTGGATTGLLTAGNLVISGPTFSASGQAFDASGTHTTTFNGDNVTVTTQTIGWGGAVANHGFQNVIIRNSAQHQYSGDQYTNGTLTFDTSMGGFGVSGSYQIYVNTLVDNSPIVGGGWNGSTALHITGTNGNLPPILRVNTLVFDGGAPILLQNNITTNYITVDHNTGLNLNGHRLDLQGNYFTTQNGGYLVMQTAGDSITANQFYFNGGSTAGLLTKGGITVAGSVFGLFYQGYDAAHNPIASSATAFAATGTRVWLNPPFVTSVAFANPGTGAAGSHFGFVQALSSNPVSLRSNVFVDSLWLGNVSGQTWQSDSSAQNIVRTVTTNGFNNSTQVMNLPAVALVLNDGVAASNVQMLTFTNFPTVSSGGVFTMNRTSAAPTVNNLGYVGLTFSGTGNFALNAGTSTVNLTLGSSIAPSGPCTSAILAPGAGCH